MSFHVEPDPGRFERGFVLYFVSEGDSLVPYAPKAVYKLELGPRGETMRVASAPPSGSRLDSYWKLLEREENHFFVSGASLHNWWIWEWIYNSNAGNYPFEIFDRTPASELGRLELWVHGSREEVGIEYRLELFINGNSVAEPFWTRNGLQHLSVDFDTSILREGHNELTIKNVTNVASAVSLDWFTVRFPRAQISAKLIPKRYRNSCPTPITNGENRLPASCFW